MSRPAAVFFVIYSNNVKVDIHHYHYTNIFVPKIQNLGQTAGDQSA